MCPPSLGVSEEQLQGRAREGSTGKDAWVDLRVYQMTDVRWLHFSLHLCGSRRGQRGNSLRGSWKCPEQRELACPSKGILGTTEIVRLPHSESPWCILRSEALQNRAWCMPVNTTCSWEKQTVEFRVQGQPGSPETA